MALHALSVLPTQEVEKDRTLFLTTAMRTLARTGRSQQALAVAEQVAGSYARTLAVAHVAGGLLEAGLTDAARTLIRTGSADLGKEVASLLHREGLSGLAPAEVKQAIEGEIRKNQHKDRQLAALINAANGVDLHAVAGYDDLRSSTLDVELVERLVRAGRFDTAVAVVFDDRPPDALGYDLGGLPSNKNLAVALARVAAGAHEVPARRQWARDLAGRAHQIALTVGMPSAKRPLRTITEDAASRAKALAAVTAYPGWPDDMALAMLRDAFSLSLGWNRYVFFSVLTEAVPFLARLGILDQTVQHVLHVDTWWTRRTA